MKKYKSSALLVALALGVVVSGLVIGASVAMSQFSQMSAQSRDGKLAYRAALSGIEDGLLRYKYAKADNVTQELFGDLGKTTIPNAGGTEISYRLGFKTDSLSVGDISSIASGASIQLLLDPAKARSINIDDTVDIDLTYFTSKAQGPGELLTDIKIYFTPPYANTTPLPTSLASNYFTAINVRLVDTSSTLSGESQLIWEDTNIDPSKNMIEIGDFVKCQMTNVTCHLRIRPQIGSRDLLANAQKAGRITGAPASDQSRSIFYAIEATTNKKLIPTQNAPGTLIISSVGSAGGARRKVEAKLDSSNNGNYLGLFDYGIYCGSECSGL